MEFGTLSNLAKSYAISFFFLSGEKTLEDLEVDKELFSIYKHLESKFQLSLRDGELNMPS